MTVRRPAWLQFTHAEAVEVVVVQVERQPLAQVMQDEGEGTVVSRQALQKVSLR